MSSVPDDLSNLKDDMVAFIEGHGMRRFPGFVDYEQVQTVSWKSQDNPDGWKDFVELAKAAAAPFHIAQTLLPGGFREASRFDAPCTCLTIHCDP